jgi:hypothetical protein
MFAPVLGDGNRMVRGHGRAIAGMPDGAFIYIFTKGPVAVKYFAVLDSSPTAIEARKSAVHVRCGVRPLVPSAMTVYITRNVRTSIGSASRSRAKSNTLRSMVGPP